MVDDDICANDCTSNGIFFFGNYTQGQAANGTQACTDWGTFEDDLAGFDFGRIAIWGSQDMVGRECVGPEADDLCKAIANGGAANVQCNGENWRVGQCGNNIELEADGLFCNCSSQYSLRPCYPNSSWGGIASNGCNAPTQTIEVVCQ